MFTLPVATPVQTAITGECSRVALLLEVVRCCTVSEEFADKGTGIPLIFVCLVSAKKDKHLVDGRLVGLTIGVASTEPFVDVGPTITLRPTVGKVRVFFLESL